MGLIKTIVHAADLHIRDSRFQEEYKIVFDKTISKLKELNPDRIVIAGDIFHTKNNVKNEGKLLAGWFLNELSKIAKVILINGNHDGNPNNSEQVNTLSTVVKLIDNPNIVYFNNTGIYQDENITWMVWDYFDGLKPYDSIVKTSDVTYIDLYHNPINGAKLFNNTTLSHNISIEDFQGDIFMLGDIHVRQFFSNSKGAKGAYPGSLIQQDYGEDYKNHGFLLWDLKTKKAKEVNIDSDYVYYNLVLDANKKPINYDDIINTDLYALKEYYKYIRIKVKWFDYRSNVSKENERKIRFQLKDFFSEEYGTETKLLEIKFEKNTIDKFEGLRSLLTTVNKEDIINKETLKDIFKRFLKSNKTEDYIIDKVLEIDELVSKGLVYEEKLVNWKLLKISIDNYRSHGDLFELSLEGKDGIWQIKGLNEHGKTNLLSAVCYLLFGKTLETLKKEKNGDNRFINNKRDLDYCEVKGLFEINNELYEIKRRTDRTWNKGKTEFKTSTDLEYKKLDSNLNEINLNDEQRLKTNKLIYEELGSFEDFLRTSFITADSLNGLLSADESVFIDSILRDAGLDLFEKKLDLFKIWKKENPIQKPKIDIDLASDEIRSLTELVERENLRLEELEDNLKLAESKINSLRKNFEKEQKKFQQIANNYTLENIAEINNKISEYQEDIKNNTIIINNKLGLIQNLPDSLSEKEQQILNTAKEKEKEIENKINETKNNLSSSKEIINKVNYEIDSINERKQNILSNELSLKKEIESEKKLQELKIETIKKEIDKLTEGKICPVCKRDKDESTIKEIQTQVDDLEKQRKILIIDSTYLEKISNIELKIDKEKNKFVSLEKELEELVKKKINYNEDLQVLRKQYDDLLIKHDSLEKELEEIEKVNEKIIKKARELEKIETLKLQIENSAIKIENYQKELEKAEEIKKILEINKLVEETVKELKNKLVSKENYIEELKKEITTIQNGVLPMSINKIEVLKKEIADFIKEEEREQIQQLYQDCVHRDGIPKMLLVEMKEAINIELSNLLSSVGFNVYFDDNLVLKMFDYIKPEAIINVIGGSGKQRTFISVALRLALRTVNNRCVNNLLFMDELMGKLVENSVTEFIQLLEEVKTKIEKIFIVEHAYSDQLNPDYIIEVSKNNLGVSYINLL